MKWNDYKKLSEEDRQYWLFRYSSPPSVVPSPVVVFLFLLVLGQLMMTILLVLKTDVFVDEIGTSELLSMVGLLFPLVGAMAVTWAAGIVISLGQLVWHHISEYRWKREVLSHGMEEGEK